MIRNYLKMAYRSLLKNRIFSFINIFGLGLGMAAFLFIMHCVRYELSYENYNPNADNIYRVTLDFYKGNEYVMTDCEVFAPAGPMFKDKLSEVTDFARMYKNDGLLEIKVGANKFLEEGIYFADPSAINMFAIKVTKGEAIKALAEPQQAVISLSVAKKYFGAVDPIGKSIEINKKLYNIASLIEDCPTNTHLKYGILLSHATLLSNPWYKEDNWSNNNEFTYVSVVPGTDVNRFNAHLNDLSIQMKESIDNTKFIAQPIKDIHLYSNKSFEPEVNGSAKAVYFLLIIAVFIIVIAWVNYVNLSTARAIERAREVGLRKVMGSMKMQLVFQFLSESVIVNLLGGTIAFTLFQTVLPIFRDVTGLALPLDFIGDINFWYLFLSMLLIGSILSGAYPAFVLSSFEPAAVLKGKFKSSSHGQVLRKGLVVFQFSATVILIVCLTGVYSQLRFLRNYDLGVNIDQTLVVRSPIIDAADSVYKTSFEGLKTELLRNPNIQKVSRSAALPGLSIDELSSTRFNKYGEPEDKGSYEYYYFSIDADFISTLGMQIVAGRDFKNGSLNKDEVIISEESAALLGFASPESAIGEKITFRTSDVGYTTIVGVVKNFYQRSPKENYLPMLFYYRERSDFISIKMNGDNVADRIEEVRAAWNKIYPNNSFYYFFLDETYNNQYKADSNFGVVIGIFSGLAIFIACLGLFGLSSYTIIQRSKEIGIRKVLGASVNQIVQLLSESFMKLIIVASVIAMPIAYLAINEWLSTYSVRIELNIWMFMVPVILILLLALITVSFQTFRTAVANPTEALKQE